MALPKIGLEAFLEMAGFNRGMRQYTSGITDMGKKTDAAGSEMKRFGKGLDDLARGGITGLITKVAGGAAALYTFQKAFEFGKEGAVISQTRESFDRLMKSMGVGPGILKKLQDASQGTVDDMTIMSSTMTLLAGTSDTLGAAIVEAAPDLMEIAKAAHKLNPALGETDFLYQSLATGIKRSSPLILDNLGLVVKVGDANEAMAKQLGKSVEALTAEEKQMALLNATLKAGDRMIQQVGGSTEEAGDSFAQAEASWKNAIDIFKEGLAPSMSKVAEVAADMADAIYRAADVTREAGKEAADASDSYDEYMKAALDAAVANEYMTKKEADLIIAHLNQGKSLDTLNDQYNIYQSHIKNVDLMTEAQWEQYKAFQALAGGMENFVHAIDPWIERQEEAIAAERRHWAMLAEGDDALFRHTQGLLTTEQQAWKLERAELAAAAASDEFKASMYLLDAAIKGEIGKGYDKHILKLDELQSKMEELTAKEKELSGQPLVTDAQRDRLSDLRGDIEETTGKLAEAKEEYGKLMAEGADPEKLEAAQGNIDRWQGKLDELNTTVSRTWRDISNATSEELASVRSDLEETAAAIDEETEAWKRQTRELAFNIAEKQILDALEKGLIEDANKSGTAFDEANDILWALAGTLGITDQATIDFMTSVQDQTQAMLDGKSTLWEWKQGVKDTADAAGEGQKTIKEMADEIRNLPEFTKSVIEFQTVFTQTGMPPAVPGAEGAPGIAKQHGGPVAAGRPYVVGEEGPEMFVPDRPGTILPHDWTMALPALASLAGGAGGTVGPTVSITMNPTINNGMDLAEFEMLTERAVQRGIRGY